MILNQCCTYFDSPTHLRTHLLTDDVGIQNLHRNFYFCELVSDSGKVWKQKIDFFSKEVKSLIPAKSFLRLREINSATFKIFCNFLEIFECLTYCCCSDLATCLLSTYNDCKKLAYVMREDCSPWVRQIKNESNLISVLPNWEDLRLIWLISLDFTSYKWAIPGLFYLLVSSFQQLAENYKILPITGFKLRTSGLGSDCFANWATTATQLCFLPLALVMLDQYRAHFGHWSALPSI